MKRPIVVSLRTMESVSLRYVIPASESNTFTVRSKFLRRTSLIATAYCDASFHMPWTGILRKYCSFCSVCEFFNCNTLGRTSDDLGQRLPANALASQDPDNRVMANSCFAL